MKFFHLILTCFPRVLFWQSSFTETSGDAKQTLSPEINRIFFLYCHQKWRRKSSPELRSRWLEGNSLIYPVSHSPICYSSRFLPFLIDYWMFSQIIEATSEALKLGSGRFYYWKIVVINMKRYMFTVPSCQYCGMFSQIRFLILCLSRCMEIRGWLILFFFALLLVFSDGSGEAAVYALFLIFNICNLS